MHAFNTILVATDFSDCAADAAEMAADLAKHYDAAVELVHVAKPADHAGRPKLEAQLGEAGVAINDAGVALVKSHVLRGTPDEAILAHAASIDANLVVMGTNGHQGLKHAIIGSTAEKVVRRAPCPVLTVRARNAGKEPPSGRPLRPWRVKNILVPTDFSTHAAAALRQASDIARHYDAHLTIMHIYLRASYLPPGTTAHIHTTPLNEAIGEFTRSLEELRATAESFGAKRVTIAPTPGVVEMDITRLAREREFDLIVMGTNGRTGLRRAIMGSIAESVVRTAPCPVLTVRDSGPGE